ncbi:uncharacterized protein LOC116427655 isoform X2 [Nomia melanderi]|nr:uncharacterized protein LOC116427655 isoform X2 [Nomia melanderi]
MVESFNPCVLQWVGHGEYVTQKFSELLARQTLVDVTLVCEEQKLRVHKLVLASNSTYFEVVHNLHTVKKALNIGFSLFMCKHLKIPCLMDILFTAYEEHVCCVKEILQQDLGQEQIIFLKDLNFEILKAMVKFMYCGETTIPHQLLSPLLNAAKTFKVEELTSVIDAMMTSCIENIKDNGNIEKKDTKSMFKNNKCNNIDCMRVKSDELVKDECFSICNKSNNDTHSRENRSLENNAIADVSGHEIEHMLYEDSQDLHTNTEQTNTSFAISDCVSSMKNQNLSSLMNCKIKEVSKGYSENSIINSDVLCSSTTLKPILYEQCCDLSDIEECEENSTSLSQTCLQEIEKDFAQYTFEGSDVPNKIGKCIKVYTHKRRKSIDEIKTKLSDVNNVIQNPPSTDCIDLLDEPSTNDIPVTLLTSLDMESAEYIISLSTENIQSIVGARLNEQHKLNICKKRFQHIVGYSDRKDNINKKELNTDDSTNSSCIKPILRRSLRLNQQDIDETANNNEIPKEHHGREKHLKKSNSPNKLELSAKRKRKVKDADCKISEQGNSNIIHSNKKTFNNSRKNTSKLIEKKNHKPQCVTTNKEKEEQSVKVTNRLKCDITETTEMDSIFTLPKSNTMEHINRALWGDMSDFSENCESRLDLDEYTPNTEIPFAVGLLPLRTALEKMQATPDYQPRKTRSSVAPIKHEANCLKRKNCTYSDKVTSSKRQNTYISDPKENAKTVCHIEIRAAPSQYIRNRKKYFTTDVATLEPSAIMNKQ